MLQPRNEPTPWSGLKNLDLHWVIVPMVEPLRLLLGVQWECCALTRPMSVRPPSWRNPRNTQRLPDCRVMRNALRRQLLVAAMRSEGFLQRLKDTMGNVVPTDEGP